MVNPSRQSTFELSAESFAVGALVAARVGLPRDNFASAEAHYRAGRAAWHLGKSAEAGVHFEQAAALAPDHPAAQSALADWCVNTGDLTGALSHSARAFSLAPDSIEPRLSRASALALSGDYVEAQHTIEPLLKRNPCPASALALLAKFARPLNNEREALAYITCRLESPTLSRQDRSLLHFAAFELLDRLEHFDTAFAHATAAHNAFRRPYDPALIRRQTDLRLAYYTSHKLHGLPRATHASRRPIFIIGMPRSGTTLIEQILASHPDIYGAGEISHLGDIVRSFAQANPQGNQDYPACMDALSLRTCNELASRYLSSLSRLNPTARYVTDKMLPNFLYLGVIATLFPDAHVIHCTRDRLDTCLSCYTTDFAFGHEFAQDLTHLCDYYGQYERLMSHWRDTLKLPMIEVSYERVVSDQESETRRLIELLDLPWNPRCLEFHRNSRHVATASVQQVRQPLYSRSVGRWRKYARHLGALLNQPEMC